MTSDTTMTDGPMVLCCQCAVAITPNPLNTCVNCLQTRYDIGEGVAKQVQQHTCRGCLRYERRDGGWAQVEPESKELLALLLRKPRGLAAVRLADANFIWTEPHSKRIKLRVTVQKEVIAGAVLQQTFVIEYIIGNKQCPHCQRREAKDTWNSLVQLRQKVPHKRTFLWMEQLILRHQAHADTVNIIELKDGLDFFFDQRAHAEKFVSFVQGIAPTRYKTSKQLISADIHTGKGKLKSTYSVEILPICKDDVIWLPKPSATSMAHVSQLVVCSKMSNVVHLLDPFTLQAVELQPLTYWKLPFKAALSRSDLAEFVVLDVELRDPEWRTRGRSRGARHGRDALCLADVTVARRLDFGKNDRTATTLTHLGHLLKAGDHVWGYCVAASTLGTELEPVDAAKLPEVILVKKSYSDKRHRQRRRVWKLRGLEKEAEPGVQRGRQFETGAYENEFEEFMQDLEEDPSLRAQINLYKDEDALALKKAKEMERRARADRAAAASSVASNGVAAGPSSGGDGKQRVVDSDDEDGVASEVDDGESDGPEDDDFPDVGLEELLDDLALGADEDDELPPGVEAGCSEAPTEVEPVVFAPPPVPVAQFTLPEGNDAKFYF